MTVSERALEIGARVEAFVRDVVAPYESDPRRDHHGAPTDALVDELKEKARAAGVMTPHILDDGGHLTQMETALCSRRAVFRRLALWPATRVRRTRGICICSARSAARNSRNAA